jgi:hypothetical protein
MHCCGVGSIALRRCRDGKNSCGGGCKRGGGQTLHFGGRTYKRAYTWQIFGGKLVEHVAKLAGSVLTLDSASLHVADLVERGESGRAPSAELRPTRSRPHFPP